MGDKKIKICYVLSYYSLNYVRTITLIEALTTIDNLILYQARNSSIGFFRYFQTLYKLLLIRIIYRPDYYILGFRGYEIFWIIRIITFGKPLIVDHLMSPYDNLLNETQTIKRGGLVDRLIYFYEKSMLRYSDIVLTDTVIHKNYFSDLFQIPPHKIHAIHVSTDEAVFKKSTANQHSGQKKFFEVLFYGSFLPLHGIDIILRAALKLRDLPIRFDLVGGNRKDLTEFYKMIKQLGLKNVTHKEWVDYEVLPELINNTDICLGGPFGNTGQAHRVITGKTFQCLAIGKPTVVGEIDYDYGFENKQNCFLIPQGNEQALADAILWAFNHQNELHLIGQQGRELYLQNFSIEKIRQNILTIFKS